MKKIITISMTALTLGLVLGSSVTTNAKGWYVGAGAGWKEAKYNENFGSVNVAAGNPTWGYAKSKLSNDSFLGLLFVGHAFEQQNFNWFLQMNGSMDSSKKEQKNVNTAVIRDADTFIRRVGSFGVDLGVSREFKGFDVALKAGLLMSRFDIGFKRNDVNFSSETHRYALGVAPGVGIEKHLGSVDVGIKYEYQMHEQLKYNAVDQARDHEGMVQGKPCYHVVALTVKKTLS